MAKKRSHVFVTIKVKGTVKSFPPLCSKCGLVRLRNERTQKAIDAGCLGAEHEDAPLTSSGSSARN